MGSMQGPGILFVRASIADDILDEKTFLRWYDADHIPEVVTTSGIKSGFRCVDSEKESPSGRMRNPKPLLTFYPMSDLSFASSDEFRAIKVSSDLLPGDGSVYDLADFEVSFLSLRNKTEKKEGAGGKQYVLTCGVRLEPGQSMDELFKKQQESLANAKGYMRTLSFELRYARANAQSRKLKGLPASDEPGPEPSTHMAMHEFAEKPSEDIVKSVWDSVAELGKVQTEVLVWALQVSHGEKKFFD
ncbi:hypothetical protein ACEQ8H_002057 [Pleosporales sp. CAS-2024a]